MSTTIVFACKSNSCRSQMAEAWAREWIRAQRAELDVRRRSRVAGGGGGGGGGTTGRHHRGGDEHDDCDHHDDRDDDNDEKIRAFLDGLFVASVALDECSAPPHHRILRSMSSPSPTSSLVADFVSEAAAAATAAAARGDTRECVTCDGEICISSSSPRVVVRRPPKEKAILAMAQDGVDISDPSTYHAKFYREILPSILVHRRRLVRDDHEDHVIGLSPNDDGAPSASGGGGGDRWSSNLAALRRMLEMASREMGMAFAGIPRHEEFDDDDGGAVDDDVDDDAVVLDNLVVLCSCPDSVVKRRLSNLSASTLEWDVDPPSASARGDEGDGAYVRVSRQIRDRVHKFLDGLKERALTAAATTSTTRTVGVGRQRRRVTNDPDRRNKTARCPSVGGVRRVRKI